MYLISVGKRSTFSIVGTFILISKDKLCDRCTSKVKDQHFLWQVPTLPIAVATPTNTDVVPTENRLREDQDRLE